jgi:hypothetical protein
VIPTRPRGEVRERVSIEVRSPIPTGLRSREVVPRKEASATAGQIEVPAKYEVLKEGEK